MAAQTKVEGARELESSARAAAADLEDMSRANAQAGDYLAGRARGMAPAVSGRLAGSVRAVVSATQVSVTAGGPGVPYAGPIHWGWPARNISAQPFLLDAMEQSETSVVRMYEADVNRTVNTIHGK
jgi:hypothetical protein